MQEAKPVVSAHGYRSHPRSQPLATSISSPTALSHEQKRAVEPSAMSAADFRRRPGRLDLKITDRAQQEQGHKHDEEHDDDDRMRLGAVDG